MEQRDTYLGLALHFFRTVYSKPQGKLLLAIWGSFLAWASTLPRKPSAEPSPNKEAPQSPKQTADLARLLKIARPHLMGWPGLVLATYIATLVTRIFITVQLADLSGLLAGKMGQRKWGDMFLGQVSFAFVCFQAALATGLMKLMEKQVALTLRGILFDRLVRHWLGETGVQLVRQHVADAPARLSSDLTDFAQEATHLLGFFLKPAIDVVHLSLVLSSRIGLRNLAIFYLFFAGADRLLRNIRERALPQSLKRLSIRGQELESQLRDRLARLHAYREQVAMQHGVKTELVAILKAYKALAAHHNETNVSLFALDVVSSYVIKYGGLMTAFSVLTPSAYLDPSKPSERIVGDFMTNSSLLGALATAVKDLGDSMAQLPRVRGLAQRVNELEESLLQVDRALPPVPAVVREGDKVRTHALTTCVPNGGQVLTRDLEWTVEPGVCWTVGGENGAGKTSLFRTLAGLWEPAAGSAQIPASAFFVPQDAYFSVDTLARQVCYPDVLDGDFGAARLLQTVGLGELEPQLGEVKEWSSVLSGGQKQRLGFARLLCHFERLPADAKAKVAFLDEPVSAVSKEAVVELIKLARKAGLTLITISHSDIVDDEHEFGLVLKRGGGWEVVERDF